MASMHISFKSGKPGNAALHSQYIAREGAYRKGDRAKDLVAVGYGNLPPGIKDHQTMWKAADEGERVNGAAYKEMVVALPRELTLDQQRQLVEEFVDRLLPGKIYQFAIHCSAASMGEGDQPHSHIMYSDRVPDGVHREPRAMFKRYNPKHPELGGFKKDSGGMSPVELRDQAKGRRAAWAAVQNEFLERYGHEARVDPRSYRDRGLLRQVEQHLGPAATRSMTPEQKTSFTSNRVK